MSSVCSCFHSLIGLTLGLADVIGLWNKRGSFSRVFGVKLAVLVVGYVNDKAGWWDGVRLTKGSEGCPKRRLNSCNL